MKLNAVTVCINYSDYLAWSLPAARHCFDRMVVVTSKEDTATQKVCQHYNVECIKTNLVTSGGKFNKGLGINLALDFLGSDDFVVHMDADIILPPRFNDFIRSKKLDPDCIYGIDRLMIKDWDTWINFIRNPFPMHYIGSTWSGLPVSYRVVQGMNYSPIGYFQLFHAKSKYIKNPVYPNSSDTAADSDLKFAAYWPPEKRILIPELYVYHLGEDGIGTNWGGRVSPKFGGA